MYNRCNAVIIGIFEEFYKVREISAFAVFYYLYVLKFIQKFYIIKLFVYIQQYLQHQYSKVDVRSQ